MRAPSVRRLSSFRLGAVGTALVMLTSVTTSVSSAGASATVARSTDAVTTATVERNDPGAFTISWTPPKGVRVKTVRWSNDPDDVDQALVASVPKGTNEVTVDDPSPGRRPYFALIGNDGARTVVAERSVGLEGDPNFRDLGGYRTVDGRAVRWGRIYRSGELDSLTDADLAEVDALGIKLVCDLRSPSEIEVAPDRTPTNAETLKIPVFDTSVDPTAVREAVLAGDVSALGAPGELLTKGGRAFVTQFGPEYSKLMARLMDPRYQPAIVHCSAGKDRAGLAAAIVLLTLGVPEKTVMQDYLLSNEYRAAANEQALSSVSKLLDPAGVEVVRSLVEVRPEYLQASLHAMRDEYGSISAYLRKGLGISPAERARFRRQMLE